MLATEITDIRTQETYQGLLSPTHITGCYAVILLQKSLKPGDEIEVDSKVFEPTVYRDSDGEWKSTAPINRDSLLSGLTHMQHYAQHSDFPLIANGGELFFDSGDILYFFNTEECALSLEFDYYSDKERFIWDYPLIVWLAIHAWRA